MTPSIELGKEAAAAAGRGFLRWLGCGAVVIVVLLFVVAYLVVRVVDQARS